MFKHSTVYGRCNILKLTVCASVFWYIGYSSHGNRKADCVCEWDSTQGLQTYGNRSLLLPATTLPPYQSEVKTRVENTLLEYCGTSLYNRSLLNFRSRVPSEHLSRVHLLVILNNPLWKVIPLVDSLYRPFFPHITYCGDTGDEALKEWMMERGFDIITYSLPDINTTGVGNGHLFYGCWIEIVDGGHLSQEAEGVLCISDDQIIRPAELDKFPLNSIWRPKKDKTLDLKTKKQSGWQWFSREAISHLPRFNGSLGSLIERAQKGEQPYKDCYRQLSEVTGGPYRVVGGHPVDMFYVPRRYLSKQATLLKIFFKHLVYVGVAVTTVHVCIEENTTQGFEGYNVAGRGRNKEPWLRFNKFATHPVYRQYYHPVKWSYLSDKYEPRAKNFTDFLCNSVLPFLHPPVH